VRDVVLQRAVAMTKKFVQEELPPSMDKVELPRKAEPLVVAILNDLDEVLPSVWPLSDMTEAAEEEIADRLELLPNDPAALVARARFTSRRSLIFGGDGYRQAYSDPFTVSRKSKDLMQPPLPEPGHAVEDAGRLSAVATYGVGSRFAIDSSTTCASSTTPYGVAPERPLAKTAGSSETNRLLPRSLSASTSKA